MKTETLFTILLALVMLTLVLIALFSYPLQAKLFPLVIGIPTLILAAIQVVRDTLPRFQPRKDNAGKGNGERFSSWIRELKGKNLGYLLTFAWIAGLILAIFLIGFYGAIPMFLFLFFKLHGQRWLFSTIMTIVMSSVLYAVFVLGFKFTFYEGLLFSLI